MTSVLVFVPVGSLGQILVGLVVRPPVHVSSLPEALFLTDHAPILTTDVPSVDPCMLLGNLGIEKRNSLRRSKVVTSLRVPQALLGTEN